MLNIKNWAREPVAEKKITRSSDIWEIMHEHLSGKHYEEFWIVMLNRGNIIIKAERISEGGISGTVVDPKRVFKVALDHYASSIVCVHNHPSGRTEPSTADIKITNQLVVVGEALECKVVDHIIYTDNLYYSFADEGSL